MSTAPKVPKNPPPLKPGMDNPWYDYAPFPTAAQARLAEERARRVLRRAEARILRAAAARDPGQGQPLHSGEFGNYSPDYRTWTQREYGNRTGIFRVLDVLDRYQIRAGVALSAWRPSAIPS